MDKNFYTIEEMADKFGISRTTMQIRVRANEAIPDGWIGKRGAYFSAHRVERGNLQDKSNSVKLFGLLDLAQELGYSLRTITEMRRQGKITEDGYLGKYPYWEKETVKKIKKGLKHA